jgi:ABC-type sugar transport system ATPase subunit
MTLFGHDWHPRHPRDAIQRGVVYLPEERKRQGLVLDHGLDSSISIGFTDLLTRCGLISRKAERSRVSAAIARYDVRSANVSQPIGTLSGGNQQKALLARWLERDPELILLDEPTRGVDVGAKAEIHALIDQLADQGKAILFVSSDLPELVGMSDRIYVMNRGRIETELTNDEMTEQNVILAASGLFEAVVS